MKSEKRKVMKKVILAYSGGLDTTCALHWLKEKKFSVICFIADLGQDVDFSQIEARAKSCGAAKIYVVDLKDEFAKHYILPALKANAIYEGKYLLSTALGRPLIARYMAEIAHKERAKAVAHGCTGKGNDQVRFEVALKTLDPDLEIIAPVREWEFKSRDEEIKYAKRFNLPIEVTRERPYSIDRNIWGVSIEAGILEDLDVEPPENIYQITKSSAVHSSFGRYIEIGFVGGIPRKINGKSYKLVDLIKELNNVGGLYGVGRADSVENRLVGIKSREIYEAPAATILHIAHKELESLVLDRETHHFKEMVSLKYSELVYYGLWFSPLRGALDKFIDYTQAKLSGKVKMRLSKGNCIVTGRQSPYSRYDKKMSTYGKGDIFNQEWAKGFIELWAMPYRHQK